MKERDEDGGGGGDNLALLTCTFYESLQGACNEIFSSAFIFF